MSFQELIMEADYDDFVIVDKYLKAIPRPTYEENHALDLKLIQKGQLDPIKVNKKMWILDGYTRHDLLGQRGKKIKYVVMDFATEQEEFEYVVESNVMRRQLNTFQRVEAMYGLFLEETLERRKKDMTSYYDILQALKDGATTTNDIVDRTKYTKRHVMRGIGEMVKSYYISQGKSIVTPHKNGVGASKMFTYKIMPKGEEVLSKRVPRKVGSVSNIIGKIIGASRSVVTSATIIIEKGSENMKQDLREGRITISTAYSMLLKRPKVRYGSTKTRTVWGKYAKIKCPHCNHVALKDDYILEKR